MSESKDLSRAPLQSPAAPPNLWLGLTGTPVEPGRRLTVQRENGMQSFDVARPERRRSPRTPLHVDIEVYGYDPDLSLIHAYGTTENVSSGGLYALLDVSLPIGSRAVMVFRSLSVAMPPHILRGTVLRCSDERDGFGIAVHFDSEVYSWTGGNDPVPLTN